MYGGPLHALRQLHHRFAQPPLREVDGRHVGTKDIGRRGGAVPVRLEGGRDDLLLSGDKRSRTVLAATASSALTLLILLVFAVEGTDGEKVDVTGNALGPGDRVVVPRFHVVRDQISRLET